jgi:hypothetical protein
LWFLWFLLALSAIAALIYRIAPGAGQWLGRLSDTATDHPVRYYAVLVVISAIAYLPLAAVFAPWQWLKFGPFGFQPAYSLHYLVFYFAGIGVGVHGIERGLLALDGPLAKHWRKWVIAALSTFLLWIIPTALTTQGYGLPGLKTIADLGLVLCPGGIVPALCRHPVADAAQPLNQCVRDLSYSLFVRGVAAIRPARTAPARRDKSTHRVQWHACGQLGPERRYSPSAVRAKHIGRGAALRAKAKPGQHAGGMITATGREPPSHRSR